MLLQLLELMKLALEAMYATMGYIVPEYYKFPGYLSPSLGLKFSDVPNGLAALSKCWPYHAASKRERDMSWWLHTRIHLYQLVSTCINWYQLVSTCIIWWFTGFSCVHAKGARARWCPDHRFRWFDWDHWILPGSFHHGRTRSTWGSVRHEGLHWDWWARQLWRWLPQLLGQGGGPWGTQEQACGRVGQRKAGYDGHHRNVFPGAMLKKHLQLHKHRHELRTSRITYLISIIYGRWCHNSTS